MVSEMSKLLILISEPCCERHVGRARNRPDLLDFGPQIARQLRRIERGSCARRAARDAA
jgi:hypothetical protein